MNTASYIFMISCLCLSAKLALSDDEEITTTTAAAPSGDRSGRKFVAEYEAPDRLSDGDAPYAFGPYGPRPRSLAKNKYIPYKHAGSGVMKKSGANLNWSVWKGDADDGSATEASEEAVPNPWINANDPWAVDPMYLMALKNAMVDIKPEGKPAGFLSKLGSDPALLLIAASIPISLLLAAVLPTLMNMWMNGGNLPMVSTTATGNTGRNYEQLDILPYLTPVMEAIGTFGAKSISNPDCMQRIFCQIAQDRIPVQESRYLRKAATFARYLSGNSWLENLGVKDLVESFGSGKCDNIPCSAKSTTDSKSRYSRKLSDGGDS